jgi:hypothetical protein
MKKIARSLRQHRELILNYFRAQKLLSSGVVGGLNNKAKVTMRKSYGFRTFRCLELALSLTCQVARAGIDPRILLMNQNFKRATESRDSGNPKEVGAFLFGTPLPPPGRTDSANPE